MCLHFNFQKLNPFGTCFLARAAGDWKKYWDIFVEAKCEILSTENIFSRAGKSIARNIRMKWMILFRVAFYYHVFITKSRVSTDQYNFIFRINQALTPL